MWIRGGTNKRPGTDHVTGGPLRGLKNNGTSFGPLGLDGAEPQMDGHGNPMTESAQWGRFSENVESMGILIPTLIHNAF